MADQDSDVERRAFLKKAGKFAATVPPAMTFLLTTSLSSRAIAQSGGTAITHNSASTDTTTYSEPTTTDQTGPYSPRTRVSVNKY